jgi:aryl-alcohol dehydrogenase-like predicted oxidoreductase
LATFFVALILATQGEAIMDYGTIPGIAPAPSVICLGTGGFGSSIPRETAFAILDAYAGQGGNFLDTAHIYAAWEPGGSGASERTLGAWLKRNGMRRRFVVGTKGAHPHLQSMQVSRLSPVEITQDLEESLERLDTDTIDLYWLHRDDPAVPVGEILGVLNEHLAAGRVRALGASNWSTARLVEAAAYAGAHGMQTFCASQIGYSLAQSQLLNPSVEGARYMDDRAWQWHRQTGVPLVAFSSQALGFFSGKYVGGGRSLKTGKDQTVKKIYLSAKNLERQERATALAEKDGRTANQIALAYLLSQPFPVFPIVGSQTVEQVLDSCAAAAFTLRPDEIAWLEG